MRAVAIWDNSATCAIGLWTALIPTLTRHRFPEEIYEPRRRGAVIESRAGGSTRARPALTPVPTVFPFPLSAKHPVGCRSKGQRRAMRVVAQAGRVLGCACGPHHPAFPTP